MGVKLVAPDWVHAQAWQEMIAEIEGLHEEVIPSALKNGTDDYEEYLAIIRQNAQGLHLPEGHVASEVFFLVDEAKNQLLGAIQIRHELNEYLHQFGGHIGYGVHPRSRCKGYATAMLALALLKCREMGMEKVLLTCFKSNRASAKTIVKNGGVLENEVLDHGALKQRYWITLT